ncbi:hypothetical protein B566_EDAN001228 [Ephemera danica]|nr:hypothetical protein B566_EDAN001228 [Ephemera danica]
MLPQGSLIDLKMDAEKSATISASPSTSEMKASLYMGLAQRQMGWKPGRNALPVSFEAAAEDQLVNQMSYVDTKCELPITTRSTFLMVFSPDGRLVASTHGDHCVYVCEMTTGACIRTLAGHPRTPWCLAFHPTSSQLLASGCLGGQVRVWDLSVSIGVSSSI